MTDETTAGAPGAGEATSAITTDSGPGAGTPAIGTSSTGGENPVSTRDALTKAFETAGLAPAAGVGDKRPAEKAAGAEKPAAGDGGKAAEKGAPGAPEGDRGDGRTATGQFAAKNAAAKAGDQAATAKPGEQQAGQQQDVGKTAPAAPPPGWSVASKAAWDSKTPSEQQWAAIKGDIAKREAEVSAGFKQYEGLKPFAERAAKQGQSLAQAVNAFYSIEELFRRDAASGFLHVAQNAGMTQAEAGKLFATLAQRLGHQFQAPGSQNPGGSPDNQNPGAGPDLSTLLAPVLEPLVKEINTLKTAHTREAEAVKGRRQDESQGVVEAFRTDPAHKFYDNLEPTIFGLLKGGAIERTGDLKADLKAAYDAACRIHPEISELLLKEQVAAEEKKRAADDVTAKAALGVNGAPGTGARSTSEKPPGSAREALKSAFAQVGL